MWRVFSSRSSFTASLATPKGRQVVVWVLWVGLCIWVHLISASLSSQAQRNKEWEVTKRIHGLVRKPFRQTVQHECKAAAVIKWVWCEINGCHSAFGIRECEKEREGKEREGKKRKREGNREKVAPREVEGGIAPGRAQPFCETEWDERRFWQNNFFSSLSFFSSLLRHLHSFYAPPFHLTSTLPPSILHLISRWPFSFIVNGEEEK